jgi:pimeloyl-ACP methyl ester carboxylesterase
MTGQESFIEIDDCRTLLRRAGAGAPILFLHGLGGVPRWLPFFDKLAATFDVMVPDHPSFGRSATPSWLDDVSDLAYYYLDVIDALKLERPHVIGHSVGGWIGLEMAIRASASLGSLTLIGSAGIRIKGLPAANTFFMDRGQLARASYVDPALAEDELAAVLSPEQVDEMVANNVAIARLGWHPRFFNPALRKWLHRVTAPAHIVWGAEDKIIPPAYADEFERLIRGASVTMVPRAGHLPHVEKADEVAAAVTTFIHRHC